MSGILLFSELRTKNVFIFRLDALPYAIKGSRMQSNCIPGTFLYNIRAFIGFAKSQPQPFCRGTCAAPRCYPLPLPSPMDALCTLLAGIKWACR